jgi:cob(I)alamin adenosyltransferase
MELSLEIRRMGQGFTWESKDIEVDKRMVREAWSHRRRANSLWKLRHRHPGGNQLRAQLWFFAYRRRGGFSEEKTGNASRDFDRAQRQAGDHRVADLVTEMRGIKHPFKQGISPQKGIEF